MLGEEYDTKRRKTTLKIVEEKRRMSLRSKWAIERAFEWVHLWKRKRVTHYLIVGVESLHTYEYLKFICLFSATFLRCLLVLSLRVLLFVLFLVSFSSGQLKPTYINMIKLNFVETWLITFSIFIDSILFNSVYLFVFVMKSIQLTWNLLICMIQRTTESILGWGENILMCFYFVFDQETTHTCTNTHMSHNSMTESN